LDVGEKMHELLKLLPEGWSITPTEKGWTIRDDEDDVIADGPTMKEVKRILNIEFALQQTFAALQFAQNLREIPEA
jgi:hypothetical protein